MVPLQLKAAAEVKSFRQARDFLCGLRRKKIAHETTVFCGDQDPSFNIRYPRAVMLLTYHSDDTFTVHPASFWSEPAVLRLNQFGPIGWRFELEAGRLYGVYKNGVKTVQFYSDRETRTPIEI